MARPLRINIADGWYHCMNRGIDRRTLFSDDKEYRHFLSLLGETVERFRFRIHAYCLLGNHFHAIIQTPDANLSQGMQWLGLAYSSWFNARHQRVGPLFQGRFKNVPVENSAWAYELSLYVHLNPIRTLGYVRERATFAEIVHAVASHRGEPDEAWMEQHGDWGKWMVLKLARQHTGLTLKELGQHMGGTDYAAICMALKRFDSRLEKDRKLKKAFTEISQMLYV